ncbi:MAG: archaeosortase/exosortase family protein [Acidobacteriota bacterium]
MAGSIAGASFLAVFGPVFLRLVQDWIHDENDSLGFIILPFAIYFAWERRQRLRELHSQPSALGLGLVCCGLALLVAGPLGAELFLTRVAAPVVTTNTLPPATQQFQMLAGRQPKSVAINTVVGVLLQMQNRTKEAQTKFEQVVQLDPRAAVAANNLAWIYTEQGARADPKNASYLYHLGAAYAGSGETDKARSALDRAIASGLSAGEATAARQWAMGLKG